jgi:hypothetical protein
MNSIKNTILEAAVLLLLTALIYEAHHSDGLTYHGVHTKFHKDSLGYSVNNKDITKQIWAPIAFLIFLTGIYDLYRWGGLRWHNIYYDV